MVILNKTNALMLATTAVLTANIGVTAYVPKIQVESGSDAIEVPVDVVAPEIVSFSCNGEGKMIDVTKEKQDVKCTVQVKDDLSGVEFISVGFYNENKNKELYLYIPKEELKEGDYQEGTFEGTITVPKGVEPGTWSMVSKTSAKDSNDESDAKHILSIGDQAGNVQTYDLETAKENDFTTEIEIQAKEYDIEPPTVKSIQCTPALIDFSNGDDNDLTKRMTCNAIVNDSKSGVRNIEAYLVSPSGEDNIPLYFSDTSKTTIGTSVDKKKKEMIIEKSS